MMQKRETKQLVQRYFTASEVAEFDYCPLVWWYEQYEQAVQADTEDLFARLVELEHEHETQAPALPEYQMIEQLLLRRGAFEGEEQQAAEYDEAFEEQEHEERTISPDTSGISRRLLFIAAITAIIGVACMLLALVLR